ncbi:MAG TPA: ABC transporter permease, partial [Candidatus Acidoferrales bacterium]
MIRQLIVNNVLHRPLRTLVSVLAVGVEVALVILIVGLTSGLVQETAKRIEGIGADIMLQPPSSSVFLAFSGAPMPIKIADKLRELKYVQAVAPVLLQFASTGSVDIIYGIDPQTFRDVSGGFVFIEGHDMQGPDDILLDDWAAKGKNLKVGDNFLLLEHNFHVSGIVEHGKGARLFVPLTTLQDLSGSRDKASVFFIKCSRQDHTAAVMDLMKPIFPGYEIRPLKDFLTLMSSANLPGLDAFIESMIALAVSIGFLVILLSMYTTVIERTRDIGVLKSIGASKGYIIRALLGESVFICLVGIGVGIVMSYITRAVFLDSFPTLSILITPDWIVRSSLIALGGGLLGASY